MLGWEEMSELKITIPGQTIVKKNSRRLVKIGKFPKSLPSKQYELWAEQALWHLKRYPKWAAGYPVAIGFFFYRQDRRRFDFSNLVQGPEDVLQQAEIIVDDDMNHIIPVIINRPGIGYGWAVDKLNPRVDIIIRSITNNN